MKASPFGNVSLSRALWGFPWPMTNLMGAWLTRNSRQPVPSPSPYVVVGLFIFIPTSVAPYSIIPSVLNWRFCGVFSNYHFGPREAGKSLINSLSRDAQNTCRPFVALFLAKASLRLLRVFPSYIYSAPSSFSFISSWLIIERDRERDHRLLLHRLSFRHFIFRQSLGLSSE